MPCSDCDAMGRSSNMPSGTSHPWPPFGAATRKSAATSAQKCPLLCSRCCARDQRPHYHESGVKRREGRDPCSAPGIAREMNDHESGSGVKRREGRPVEVSKRPVITATRECVGAKRPGVHAATPSTLRQGQAKTSVAHGNTGTRHGIASLWNWMRCDWTDPDAALKT